MKTDAQIIVERIRKKITVWKFVNLYPSAKIGNNVSIGSFSEVGNNVIIGDDTRVGMGVFICEGVEIGKRVFVSPRVCFCNDRLPAVGKKHWQGWEKTIVKDDVSIGANATILPGITLGKGCIVGAGAVVTKSVPPYEIHAGCPAVKIGLV